MVKFDSEKMKTMVIDEVNNAFIDGGYFSKTVNLPADFPLYSERVNLKSEYDDVRHDMEVLVIDLNETIEKFENAEGKNISVTYNIKPGDYLIKIAREHGYSDSDYVWIAKLNNIQNPNLIYAGNDVIIPDKDAIEDFEDFKKKVMAGEITLDNLEESLGAKPVGEEEVKVGERENLDDFTIDDDTKEALRGKTYDEIVEMINSGEIDYNAAIEEYLNMIRPEGAPYPIDVIDEDIYNGVFPQAGNDAGTGDAGRAGNNGRRPNSGTVNPEDVLLSGGAAAVIDGVDTPQRPKANPEQVEKERQLAYDSLTDAQKQAIAGKSFDEIINMINSNQLDDTMALMIYLNYIKPDDVEFAEDLIDSKKDDVTGNGVINENAARRQEPVSTPEPAGPQQKVSIDSNNFNERYNKTNGLRPTERQQEMAGTIDAIIREGNLSKEEVVKKFAPNYRDITPEELQYIADYITYLEQNNVL